MLDVFAAVEARDSLLDLASEPSVMVELCGHEVDYDLVRAAPRIRRQSSARFFLSRE